MTVEAHMAKLPIVAIIRGVTPERVIEVGQAIIDAGISVIEVPLNSPDPFTSIKLLSDAFPDIITGAGTVTDPDDVAKVKQAGGTIIVSPNTNADVIKSAIEQNMIPMPGFQTISEAFTALKAGATYLKLFPAGALGPDYVKAIKSVLPKSTKILAVGGAGAASIDDWQKVGIDGYGIGSEIFTPSMTIETIRERAQTIVLAHKQATQ